MDDTQELQADGGTGIASHQDSRQPEHTPYHPFSKPLDLSNLAIDPDLETSSTESTRVSSGSTIPDPASVEENGRTYQAYKHMNYFLPNDAQEQDRLDLQHHLIKLVKGGQLHEAPLPHSPKNVLDIGTGTGIWAIEFAEAHPDSTVIGTDLSQIQPQYAAPPNCSFVREDVEDEWTLGRRFDFVHLRYMCTCFNDHRAVMKKIWDNLEPGGWVEYHDSKFEINSVDGSTKGTNLERWGEIVLGGAAKVGRDFNVAVNYSHWMHELGFVDVVERYMAIPGGSWPLDPKQKEIGLIAREDVLMGVEAASRRILSGVLQWSVEDVDNIIELVKKDLVDKKIKWYMTNVCVYGRKPLEGEKVEGLGPEFKS